MRIASKITLLAVMGLSAMALMATSAFANPVEVLDERATPVHCGAVGGTAHNPSGGCEFHVTGTGIDLYNHAVSAEPVASCFNEFTVNVDEDGVGKVSEANITGDGACPFIDPCVEDINFEELPWAFTVEALDAGGFHAVLNVCFDSPSGQCAGSYEVRLNAAQTEFFNLGLPQSDTVGPGPCEVNGHWAVEAAEIGSFHVE